MFLKAEAKQKAKGLADLLDYYALIDDGIVLLSNASFLAAWEVRGPDMEGFDCAPAAFGLRSSLPSAAATRSMWMSGHLQSV